MLNGSLPTFDFGAGQALAAGGRALALMGLFGFFGTLGLRLLAARMLARTLAGERATRRLAWGSLALFACGLAGWIVAQSALLAGVTGLGASLRAAGPVLQSTAYGHLAHVAGRGGGPRGHRTRRGLGLGRRRPSPLRPCCCSRAISTPGRWSPGLTPLLICEALHLLAAAAWLGALPALFLLVRLLPPDDARALSRHFSVLGGLAVLVIAATATWQGWTLSGGLPGLIGTAYGWTELVKLGLFGLILVCAAANRWRFTPRLAGPDPAAARRALAGSIAIETALGLLVVVAATVLTSLEPGMHMEPIWPFSKQPSLMIVREDAVFRQEVMDALLALLGALALVALGFVVRWLRWIAWAVALVIGWFAVPHLDLLFIPAYPTSFFHSPTGFAATSIADGAALYPSHCASCHGAEGRGDGPAAKGLELPPADLTAEHLWAHSDGELFWWLSHGMASPEGRPVDAWLCRRTLGARALGVDRLYPRPQCRPDPAGYGGLVAAGASPRTGGHLC